MITEVLTQDGKKISAGEAVRLRDKARALEQEEPSYFDPLTGDTLILPRKGHYTLLSHAEAHFYRPSDIKEKGIGTERKEAIERLEVILRKTGEFTELKKGVLGFEDIEMKVRYDSIKPDFDYGFQVLWARKNDGEEYALLVLNRVPYSEGYLGLLRSLGNRERFEKRNKISKVLISENGEKQELGTDVYLATVQLKNRHLYRINEEEPHPANSLMLGDWQLKHLSKIYPEFVYFDPAAGTIEAVELKKFKHNCSYSDYRYKFKNKETSEEPEFCQLAISTLMDRFILKPFEVKKDSLSQDIGEHPRLYLASFAPQLQGRLF